MATFKPHLHTDILQNPCDRMSTDDLNTSGHVTGVLFPVHDRRGRVKQY